MPNLQNISASSAYDGFKNLPSGFGTTHVNSFSLGAHQFTSVGTTVAFPAGFANLLMQAQVQYAGVDNNTYLVPGYIAINYPNNNSVQYQLQTILYTQGNTAFATTYIINQTGAAITIPTMDINITFFFYLAPF